MTLKKFEQLVQSLNPKFNIKVRSYTDVVACLYGTRYLFRLNKGELQVESGRYPDGTKRRGRRAALDLLVNYRVIGRNQANKILWGIE